MAPDDTTFVDTIMTVRKLQAEVDMLVYVLRARLDVADKYTDWIIVARQLQQAAVKSKRIVRLLRSGTRIGDRHKRRKARVDPNAIVDNPKGTE